MWPVSYSRMSSLDSTSRTLGSFRCWATQSVETSTSGWAYPRCSMGVAAGTACAVVMPFLLPSGSQMKTGRGLPWGVRPVGLDDLLSSRATALPPGPDTGGVGTAHDDHRALRQHRINTRGVRDA